MMLHLGDEVMIPTKSIVAIMSMAAAQSRSTKAFLQSVEDKTSTFYKCKNKPKAFIVAQENSETKVYYSPISAVTLVKRSKIGIR